MTDPLYGLCKLTPAGRTDGCYSLFWMMTMTTIKPTNKQKTPFPSLKCKWISRINYIQMN